MNSDPNLPAGTTQQDLDNFYGDGSVFCHDCGEKIPLGQENEVQPYSHLHIFIDICNGCYNKRLIAKEIDEGGVGLYGD